MCRIIDLNFGNINVFGAHNSSRSSSSSSSSSTSSVGQKKGVWHEGWEVWKEDGAGSHEVVVVVVVAVVVVVVVVVVVATVTVLWFEPFCAFSISREKQ